MLIIESGAVAKYNQSGVCVGWEGNKPEVKFTSRCLLFPSDGNAGGVSFAAAPFVRFNKPILNLEREEIL